jgi:two-component sensor histidine kinase
MLAGNRATALALVFSELLGNALEHGGRHVRVVLQGADGEAILEVADDGAGIQADPPSRTGLSIVRALVRDELGGTLELDGSSGTRARVRFPA